MGQVLFSTFFFPQRYSQTKGCYINLSTDLSTLSTGEKVFIHIVPLKTYHYILNSTDLCTTYPQIVHKYRCSLLTLQFIFVKKESILSKEKIDSS